MFNRELSWLAFNKRVLFEMADASVPIYEKLKFSAIFSNNLDEFYMVRVAAYMNLISSGYINEDPSGRTPSQVLEEISEVVSALIDTQQKMTQNILHQTADVGFEIIRSCHYTEEDLNFLENHFKLEILSVLTPMAVDFSRPFPLLTNKVIYVGVKLRVSEDFHFALVEVPKVLPRLVKLKKKGQYALLEDVIAQFADQLFLGHQVLHTCFFRVTRNGDLHLMNEEAEDLLMVVEEAVKHRKWGESTRLEFSMPVDPWLKKTITDAVVINTNQVFLIDGIMDYTFLFNVPIPKKYRTPSYIQKFPIGFEKKSLFKSIKEHDIFLHHPYESFDPVVQFVASAAKDPQVLAIKQTLYRVSGNSPIIKALANAAESGKQVTVLVELMARFDEENNINWAKKLEKKGAHVIYGLNGLKTHSKITLVVRKEKNKIRRYLHLSTGNYNDQTSKLYTDMSYMTCKESFGADATVFFNMLSGFMRSVKTPILSVAPYRLRDDFYALIDREIVHAQKGKMAHMIIKVNSLVDPGMVKKLYEASQAGVQIDLIVRGICVLRPGVPGLSERITVKSIIGEYLEHCRIFYFKNAGKSEIYLSSADWMSRNLNRRIELMFPIQEPEIADRIHAILCLYLADNRKSWHLTSDGTYEKHIPENSDNEVIAQNVLKNLTYENNRDFVEQLLQIIEKNKKN